MSEQAPETQDGRLAEAEAEIARLRAKLEGSAAAPAEPEAAPEQEAPAPTHDLLLSDGTVVPSHGAIPTHVHIGDVVHRVVAAVERTVP